MPIENGLQCIENGGIKLAKLDQYPGEQDV